jgi:hypothetical protein
MNTSRISLFLGLFLLAVSLTGCDAIGSIFKAGAYTGIIAVVLVVILVLWLMRKMRRRG